MFCSFGRLRLIMALSEHLDQLSRGPPLYGGAALDVNINASSGLKTRLTAIIKQHFACISRSLGPRAPDPKLERSSVIKVSRNPTLLLGGAGGIKKNYDGDSKRSFSAMHVCVTQQVNL